MAQQHIVQPETTAEGILTHSRMVGVDLRVRDVAGAVSFYEHFLERGPLRQSDQGASFDVGPSVLWIRHREGQVGSPGQDRTVALTFMVSNIDATVDRLRGAGIAVGDPFRYEVGATADLYDPEGHWLSLYEPSPAAMTWPSGSKLAALAGDAGSPRLVYLFMFVPDAEEAFDFYNGTLGLSYLECRACRRGSTDHARGVVKYDAGGVMLTTHLVEGAHDSPAAEAVRDRRLLAEVTPVFASSDLTRTGVALAAARLTGERSARTAELLFADPFGRPFAVLEGSARPGGVLSGPEIDRTFPRFS